MFMKFCLIIMLIFMLTATMFLSFNMFYSATVMYGNFMKMMMFFMTAYTDSFTFIIMVSLVTMFICFFNKSYLEWYDNKKYFYLMMIFFFSMLSLSMSMNFLYTILCWDFLGVSSIFLILFYPNQINSNNSIITMFFNRLGDFYLMVAACLLIYNGSTIYMFMLDQKVIFFLVICMLTKSAQFPMSLWLPLAMSAPTPISAMVHSSTLVTAGTFLLMKIIDFDLSCLKYFAFLMTIFNLSMITGGVLANLEYDYKKIIAFSTLSQISMLMVFFSCGYKIYGIFQMMFHSIYKSYLFTCSGLSFHFSSMDQEAVHLKSSWKMGLDTMLYLSIYPMTGLAFSLSFYAKDMVLENLMLDFHMLTVVLLCMMLSSFLTLLYCCKLLEMLKNNINKYKYTSSKKFSKFLLISPLFCLLFWMVMELVLHMIILDSWKVCILNIFMVYFCLSGGKISLIISKNLSYNFLGLNSMLNIMSIFMHSASKININDNFLFTGLPNMVHKNYFLMSYISPYHIYLILFTIMIF